MRESGYHFVFSIENIGALKELLDEVGMHPELYIDAQFMPPARDKELNPETGRYEYEDSPAELYLDLVIPVEIEDGVVSWKAYKAVSYQETKENPASGMAIPPRFIEEMLLAKSETVAEDKHTIIRYTWPDRYDVYAQMESIYELPEGFGAPEMLFFQPEMSEEEIQALLEPFDFTPDREDYDALASQAMSSFTEEQAGQLMEFLQSLHDSRIKPKKIEAFVPLEYAGIDWEDLGEGDFWKLDEMEGYDLGFRVWGYSTMLDWLEPDIISSLQKGRMHD